MRLRGAMHAAAELEAAWLRLLAVTPAHLVETVKAEVSGRTPNLGPSAALESVYDDVTRGRLR